MSAVSDCSGPLPVDVLSAELRVHGRQVSEAELTEEQASLIHIHHPLHLLLLILILLIKLLL